MIQFTESIIEDAMDENLELFANRMKKKLKYLKKELKNKENI